MLRRHRQSWPARITALGFIVALIFGNIWLADAMLAVLPPGWVIDGILIGMLTAIAGGIGMGGLAVLERLNGDRRRHESDDDE